MAGGVIDAADNERKSHTDAARELIPAPYDRDWLTHHERIALGIERVANCLEADPAGGLSELMASMIGEPPAPEPSGDEPGDPGTKTPAGQIYDLPIHGARISCLLNEDHSFDLWLQLPGGEWTPLTWNA